MRVSMRHGRPRANERWRICCAQHVSCWCVPRTSCASVATLDTPTRPDAVGWVVLLAENRWPSLPAHQTKGGNQSVWRLIGDQGGVTRRTNCSKQVSVVYMRAVLVTQPLHEYARIVAPNNNSLQGILRLAKVSSLCQNAICSK